MKHVTPLSLVLGLVLSAPALWSTFQTTGADLTPALLRFIVATLLAGAGLAGLRQLVHVYARAGAQAADPVGHRPGSASTVEDGA